MSFTHRPYVPEDYATIEPWFRAHGWPPNTPHSTILSTSGVIVEDDNGPCAVGFLYFTNSPMAFLEWIGTKPGLRFGGIKALDFLLGVIKEICRHAGTHKLMHLPRPGLKRVWEGRFGFQYTETAEIMIWGDQ